MNQSDSVMCQAYRYHRKWRQCGVRVMTHDSWKWYNITDLQYQENSNRFTRFTDHPSPDHITHWRIKVGLGISTVLDTNIPEAQAFPSSDSRRVWLALKLVTTEIAPAKSNGSSPSKNESKDNLKLGCWTDVGQCQCAIRLCNYVTWT